MNRGGHSQGGSRERGQEGWGPLGREGSEQNPLCCFWAEVLSPSTGSPRDPVTQPQLTETDARGWESEASQILGPTLGKEGVGIR